MKACQGGITKTHSKCSRAPPEQRFARDVSHNENVAHTSPSPGPRQVGSGYCVRREHGVQWGGQERGG